MAVTSVNITNRTGYGDQNGTYRTDTYQVILDAVPVGPDLALNASAGGTSIPNMGAYYPGSPTIRCRKVGPAQQSPDSRLVWEVPVEYDDQSDFTWFDNPLNRDPDITFGTVSYEVPVEKDINSKPIVNSTGDAFVPGLLENETRLVVTITRNLSTWSGSNRLQYVNTINGGSVQIAGISVAAKAALITDIKASNKTEDQVTYVEESIAIEFAGDYTRHLLDRGVNMLVYREDSGDMPTRITDANGDPITEPVMLDGEGKQLAFGGTPVYRDFETKRPANWSGLSLPTTFP